MANLASFYQFFTVPHRYSLELVGSKWSQPDSNWFQAVPIGTRCQNNKSTVKRELNKRIQTNKLLYLLHHIYTLKEYI